MYCKRLSSTISHEQIYRGLRKKNKVCDRSPRRNIFSNIIVFLAFFTFLYYSKAPQIKMVDRYAVGCVNITIGICIQWNRYATIHSTLLHPDFANKTVHKFYRFSSRYCKRIIETETQFVLFLCHFIQMQTIFFTSIFFDNIFAFRWTLLQSEEKKILKISNQSEQKKKREM